MITKLLNRLADILIKPIMEAIEAMQGDRADFNDITCVRNRACRLTKEDALKEKIENIRRGGAATLPTDDSQVVESDEFPYPDYKEGVYVCRLCTRDDCPKRYSLALTCVLKNVLAENIKAEQEELPPMCVRCHRDESCGFYDETLTYCGDFYPPQNAVDVGETNVEAAESVKEITGINGCFINGVECAQLEMKHDPKIDHLHAGMLNVAMCRLNRPIGQCVADPTPRHESTKKACKESIGHEVE